MKMSQALSLSDFMSIKDFYGSCLLRALEREQEKRDSGVLKKEEQKRNIPQISNDIGDAILYMQHFEILYGYRPADPVIFFLNAWEFMMWWAVMPKKFMHTYSKTHFVLDFPEAALQLRQRYFLVRRTRPIVPAPEET